MPKKPTKKAARPKKPKANPYLRCPNEECRSTAISESEPGDTPQTWLCVECLECWDHLGHRYEVAEDDGEDGCDDSG